jgi:VanZ family protein
MLRGWVMTGLFNRLCANGQCPSCLHRNFARGRTAPNEKGMTSSRFERLARVLFWIALLGATVLALMPTPPHLPSDRLGDKVNHMIAFATLAALAALGWPRAERLRMVERLSFLGALIEVTQAIPALHRDCDIRDWAADTVAIVVVTAIFALLARRQAPAKGS